MGFLSRVFGSGDEQTGVAGLPGAAPPAVPAAGDRPEHPRLQLRVGDTVVIDGVRGEVVERVVHEGEAEARLSFENRDCWLEETAYFGDRDQLALWRVRNDVMDAYAEPLIVDGVTYEGGGGAMNDAAWEGPAGATREGTWFIDDFTVAGTEFDEDGPFLPYPVRAAQFDDDNSDDDMPTEVHVSELIRLVDIVVERA